MNKNEILGGNQGISKRSENSLTNIDISIDSIVFEGFEGITEYEKIVAAIKSALPLLIMNYNLEFENLFKGTQKRRKSFLGSNDDGNNYEHHVDIREIDSGAFEFSSGMLNGYDELANGVSDSILRGLFKAGSLRDVSLRAQNGHNTSSSDLTH